MSAKPTGNAQAGKSNPPPPAPTKSNAPVTNPKPSPAVQSKIKDVESNLKLQECKFCKRKFTLDRIDLHQRVCRAQKKDKATTTKSKQKTKSKQGQNKRPSRAQYDWRKDAEQFDQLIKSMKGGGGSGAGKDNALRMLPPTPMDFSDYVQCPHCGQKFNKEAGDRHIPQCKNFDYNKARK